jgi:hypothetical protein
LLADVILPVLADPSIPDEQVGGILRGKIGMSKLREVMAGPWKPLPKDHGRLSARRNRTYRLTPLTLPPRLHSAGKTNDPDDVPSGILSSSQLAELT